MEADFINAVFAHVESLNILPCCYPNIPYQPVSDHIRVSVIPTSPQKIRLCVKGSKHTWIVQCSVYVRDGTGVVKAAEYVDQLRNGIPYLLDIGGFTCVNDGESFPPVSVDAWCFIPVQFRFVGVA